MEYHVTKYYASKNFNWWYVFGVLAFVVLVIQLITGIFLTMNYKPSADEAFARSSTSCAMSSGVAHSIHAFDGRIVLLHRRLPAHVPRNALRLLQEAARAHLADRHDDFFVLMAEGFAGTGRPGADVVLGAEVMTAVRRDRGRSDGIVESIREDPRSDTTLNRFSAPARDGAVSHLIGSFVDIVAPHEEVGNPDGIEIKSKGSDGATPGRIGFHPYQTSKDGSKTGSSR